VSAYTAAELGARVALVERDRTGGDCLWTGCVPSKALLAAAHTVATARRASRFASVGRPEVDMAAVRRHVRSAIATIEPVDSPDALRAAGVTVLVGQAELTGPAALTVDGQPHRFRRAVLATGAAPVVPTIPGLVEVQPVTSESVWDLERLPERLLVIGGGPVGCEMSQAFARLGAAVTLVEIGDRLLPREDPDAARIVADALRADGVDLRLGQQVARVLGHPAGAGQAVVDDGTSQTAVAFDACLVAVGRRARTAGLGLDRADVRLTPSGAVAVDRYLRTSNPAIWAAGDVTPFPHLTHLAAHHAGLATANALLGLRRGVDLSAVPRVVYTDPEVAAVGRSTWSNDPATPVRTITRHHDHVDRAIAEGRTEGFSRLALTRTGSRIIGATIVGPRAGESIAEMTLAVRARMRVTDLAATMHAYPTYADGPWNAAVDEVRRRLAHPRVQRVARAWIASRGRSEVGSPLPARGGRVGGAGTRGPMSAPPGDRDHNVG
jgi:pyruvate/2-oxoglutarate dehydrogenase complex dihydrolipoamide dehydrogenase (E3) component